MDPIDARGDALTQTYMAMTMYKDATWIRTMAEAFKSTDTNRAPLDMFGPWTIHTRNIQEYAQHSRFDAFA